MYDRRLTDADDFRIRRRTDNQFKKVRNNPLNDKCLAKFVSKLSGAVTEARNKRDDSVSAQEIRRIAFDREKAIASPEIFLGVKKAVQEYKTSVYTEYDRERMYEEIGNQFMIHQEVAKEILTDAPHFVSAMETYNVLHRGW